MKKLFLLLVALLILPLAAQAGKKHGSDKSSDKISVVVVEGGVKVQRNGKTFSKIWTKFPDVRGWKFLNGTSEIVIKSGINREPGFVELFDVNSGKRIDKIKAKDVRDGRPSWAKNFAE